MLKGAYNCPTAIPAIKIKKIERVVKKRFTVTSAAFELPLVCLTCPKSKRTFRARRQPDCRLVLIGNPNAFQPLPDTQTSDKYSHRIEENCEGIQDKMHLSTSRRLHYKILDRSVSSCNYSRWSTKSEEQKTLDFRGAILISFQRTKYDRTPMDKPVENKSIENTPGKRLRNTQLFDFIVLIGMVLNMLLAVFLVLYYFDLL